MLASTRLGHAFLDDFGMAWPVPSYSKSQIKRAGDILRDKNVSREETLWARQVLVNWRACHGYPLHTFQNTLRERIARLGWKDVLVSNRLKRLPSITSKLRRMPQMDLSRMQDIGGLRIVVPEIADVRRIEAEYRASRRHRLAHDKDYILEPKPDGYRGIHLIFKYEGTGGAKPYTGLSVELQIRSRLQHIWATGVETLGTLLGEKFKSGEGDQEWRRFFALLGSAFARLEKTPPLKEHESLSPRQTLVDLLCQEERLGVRNKLHAINIVDQQIEEMEDAGNIGYYLVILDLHTDAVRLRPFGVGDLARAMDAYDAAEQSYEKEAVLVSTASLADLRNAYPSYFMDVNDLIDKLDYINGIVAATQK